jgi:ethylbenzene dioxygenase beta subunit
MPTTDRDIHFQIEQFIQHEAQLLDECRFGDWLALFAEDGWYWIPASVGQTDPWNKISIIHEDLSVLRMRVRRIDHPRAYSLNPAPRTAHVISSPAVTTDPNEEGAYSASSALSVAIYQDGKHSNFHGRQTLRLRPDGDGFKIILKRVDLIDCDAVHGLMPVPI